MSTVDQNLYQQLILEHNRKPKNFGAMSGFTHFAKGFNPLCGDRYDVYLSVDEQGIIADLSFTGEGCAISKASASLMTERVKGKHVDEAKQLFTDFRELLQGSLSDSSREQALGKLKIFSGIWKYPARVKCAGLSWHALAAALDKKETVSTE